MVRICFRWDSVIIMKMMTRNGQSILHLLVKLFLSAQILWIKFFQDQKADFRIFNAKVIRFCIFSLKIPGNCESYWLILWHIFDFIRFRKLYHRFLWLSCLFVMFFDTNSREKFLMLLYCLDLVYLTDFFRFIGEISRFVGLGWLSIFSPPS